MLIDRRFFRDESGQDLAEYCLLIPLLLLIGLGIFIQLSGGIHTVWGNAGTVLNSSNGEPTSPFHPGGQ